MLRSAFLLIILITRVLAQLLGLRRQVVSQIVADALVDVNIIVHWINFGEAFIIFSVVLVGQNIDFTTKHRLRSDVESLYLTPSLIIDTV